MENNLLAYYGYTHLAQQALENLDKEGNQGITLIEVNTLWIPESNNEAVPALNKKGTILPFDPSATFGAGNIWGEDEKGKRYAIISVPAWFTDQDINELALALCKELNVPEGTKVIGVLQAVMLYRIHSILDAMVNQRNKK